MNKVLAFLSFIFLVSSCDQSIESRLSKQKGKSNESGSKVENIESKAPDLKSDKVSESENKDSKLAESTEKLANKVTQPESEKAQPQNINIEASEKKDATSPKKVDTVSSEQAKEHLPEIKESSSSLTQASVSKTSKDISKPVKKNKQPKVVKDVTSKPSLSKENKEDKKVVKTYTVTTPKKKLQESKASNSAKLEIVKEEKAVAKLPPAKVERKANESDGTYENGKLVSNFTIEELRLGSPRPLSKEEIKYFKRLCRYALMSEQEIIENGCQTKKVTFSR